ncbi:hypothetical protein F4823DRAFT_632352 [Ustulina deusta]|nr:hypothetical protein F4823DRAFT_632352 [Ustulina deusta]
MSGYDPTASSHSCIAGDRIEASSLLPRTNSADSPPPRQPHDGTAVKRPCTRPSAALIEAVTIWREGIQNPSSTDTLDIIYKTRKLCVRPSYHSEAITLDLDTSSLNCSDGPCIDELSLCCAFPSLSELHLHEPSSSGSDSGVDSTADSASDRPVPATAPESDIIANETMQTMAALHSISRQANDALLPTQSAVIKECVKYGEHLAALTHALRYSYDFTFQRNPSEVFSARIHVYNLGKKNEVPGITMRFYKALHPGFKRFLARRLLNGLLIRYPKAFFPRTFCVAEGDEEPVVLQTYDAVGSQSYRLGRGRDCCRDVIVQQWRWERQRGCERDEGAIGWRRRG